jgi:NAD(P)-dependent dehydrogenase (short-subunit alcohol dehydrogenase family)
MSDPLPSVASAFDLSGHVALITGGGSGLGLGMARCLVAAGARVVLVGRREAELMEARRTLGDRAFAVPADITEAGVAPRLVEQAESLAGPLTILVNNAGVHLKKPATQTSDADFAAVLQTHVFGAFSLAREAGIRMLDRKNGSILFTASMTSFIGMPMVVAYSAAKSAYVGMVRSLAAEFGPTGVRVNAIAPGWIASDMLDKALSGDPARKDRILARTPLGRFGEPDDIGWAAVYLCSPAGRFINGHILPVDGGAAMGF